MSHAQRAHSPQDPVDDRRFPRIELIDELKGQLAPSTVPLVVVDLSSGGFATESGLPFMLNREYTFRFGSTFQHGLIRGKNVHCLRVGRDGAAAYLAGFSFVIDSAVEQAAVNAVLAEAQRAAG